MTLRFKIFCCGTSWKRFVLDILIFEILSIIDWYMLSNKKSVYLKVWSVGHRLFSLSTENSYNALQQTFVIKGFVFYGFHKFYMIDPFYGEVDDSKPVGC